RRRGEARRAFPRAPAERRRVQSVSRSMTAFVERIDVAPLDVPMKKAFGIAGGAQEAVRNVLVTVVLRGGARGYGEAAPLPAVNGETQGAALDALRRAADALVGEDTSRWRAFAERARDACGASAAAACAVETAALDAWTRTLGVSLRTFFGGTEDAL